MIKVNESGMSRWSPMSGMTTQSLIFITFIVSEKIAPLKVFATLDNHPTGRPPCPTLIIITWSPHFLLESKMASDWTFTSGAVTALYRRRGQELSAECPMSLLHKVKREMRSPVFGNARRLFKHCPGHVGIEEIDGGESNYHKRLASKKIWRAEELRN